MELPSLTHDIYPTARLLAKEMWDGSVMLANDYGKPALIKIRDLFIQLISSVAHWVKNDLRPLAGKGVRRVYEALKPAFNRGASEAIKFAQKAKGTSIGVHLTTHSRAYMIGSLATLAVATVAYAAFHVHVKAEEAKKAP